MKYVYLLGTVGLMALGQILFKTMALRKESALTVFFSLPFAAAAAIYGTAAITWFFALRELPLTVAYPAQSLAIVVVMLVGMFGFRETLTPLQLFGAGTIIIGLLLIGYGQR